MATPTASFPFDSPSQKVFQELLDHVKRLERKVNTMRRKFRPYKPPSMRSPQLPLFPSPPKRKVFLYFSHFPRRRICLVKSALRTYDLDVRGLFLSFVGPSVLEVLVDEDKSEAFSQEMQVRGHAYMKGWQPFTGFEVQVKGTFLERLQYAQTACQRRWLQLRSLAKDRASFQAFTEALDSMEEKVASYKGLSPVAPSFSSSTPSDQPPPTQKKPDESHKKRKSTSQPDSTKPSSTSTPSSPARPSSQKSSQGLFNSLRKGFLQSSHGNG